MVAVRLVKVAAFADTPDLVQIWGDVQKPLAVLVPVHIANGSRRFTSAHAGINNWFKVVGDTKDELTKKYMEMCMVSVTEVVYSNKEQALGVKRLFPFNYDVIMPDDTELKGMLESLVNEVNG